MGKVIECCNFFRIDVLYGSRRRCCVVNLFHYPEGSDFSLRLGLTLFGYSNTVQSILCANLGKVFFAIVLKSRAPSCMYGTSRYMVLYDKRVNFTKVNVEGTYYQIPVSHTYLAATDVHTVYTLRPVTSVRQSTNCTRSDCGQFNQRADRRRTKNIPINLITPSILT